MSLLAELRRRNVFRVGIAHVVLAWLLLQVGDTLAPALHYGLQTYERDPLFVPNHAMLSYIYNMLGRYEEALLAQQAKGYDWQVVEAHAVRDEIDEPYLGRNGLYIRRR